MNTLSPKASIQKILSPNRWSCLPVSFANVLTSIGIPTTLEDICKYVGHTGSEDLYPHLTIPESKRGFHIQEMTDYCLYKDVNVINIVPLPYHTPYRFPDLEIIIDFHQHGHPVSHEARLMEYLSKYHGVIVGKSMHNYAAHAVSWDTNKMHDPSGYEISFDHFQILHFYILV